MDSMHDLDAHDHEAVQAEVVSPCDDCPDPGLCMAESACCAGGSR